MSGDIALRVYNIEGIEMFTTLCLYNYRRCFALGLMSFWFLLTAELSADIIKVTNNGSAQTWTLADLIAYNDTRGESEVIKVPGDDSDDIEIGLGNQVLFFADFEVTRVAISTADGSIAGGDYFEWETIIFDVEKSENNSIPIALLGDEHGDPNVFLAIDVPNAAVGPPPRGTLVSVNNGVIAGLPGWFVGTEIDLSTGIVSNAYTGSALVISDEASVTVLVPEPSDLWYLSLASLFSLACQAVRRRP